VQADAYWATPAAHTAFSNAISAAIGVRDSAASTQEQINAARVALVAAYEAFSAERSRAHVDLSGLNAAIFDAQALLGATEVSADGSDVQADAYWATPAAHTTFYNAIGAAIGVRDSAASTQEQISAARVALVAAHEVFSAATSRAHVDLSGLNAAISAAQAMFTNTSVSANAADVFNVRYWTTTAVRTVFQNAIAAAQSVYANTASTQAQINLAAATLRDATSAFERERRLGTLSPPPAFVDMVRVGGGVFYLGREEGTAGIGNEIPISRVTMSGFYIGRFPITQGQWYAVMGTWPSFFTGTNNQLNVTVTPTLNRNNLPVERVSWYEAIVFSNRLSILRGLSPAYELPNVWPNPATWSTDPDTWGAVPTSSNVRWNNVRIVSGSTGYRLPTEAQWEFAAKGGPLGGNYTFSGSNDINAVAWHSGNSGNRTREVGGLDANQLGIHDMSGNVWEWVWDWWGLYTSVDKTDPSGASSGSLRGFRGGSWGNLTDTVRSVNRIFSNPAFRDGGVGFRVARP